ncbi:NUDIX domain-containing protein [Clostridium estertheticum]|uniref:NUDIX hydrolase n=1 Tax=Clostridium estertheticum TaxID=238834 RepID=UPI001CF20FF4|nr:NUDIX domain-containing protein [Clostridium estertheticum]MCB2305594.1 NUDIX domain-containing protein [Clostridium estertheticum]MCB2344033.1 NUDIX domain-containing protein [Clostridium estertheticum]MCB2348949.1 NUDIX domain-containing protein [Clostridium estertheticum]WAG46263.1 NUDIX domain-containing protein [Clostridium estertheticum]
MDRHFTVSIYIVHKDKVLLHLHKKAKKILPLGGHIELNESPEEACIRETQEESGLKINLYNPLNKQLKNSCELVGETLLINPMYTILGEINPQHYHIDFVYYATANSFDTMPGDGESNLLKWYNKEDLKKAYNIQYNILTMANEALKLLGDR